MVRLIAVIIAAALVTGTLAMAAVAAETSSKNGTASITWKIEEKGGGGNSGGGDSGGGSGGSGSGGGNSGGNSGGSGGTGGGGGNFYGYNRRSPASNVIVNPAASPQAFVSIPNPQVPLGKLPATGGSYLIPLLFLAAGMSFICASAKSGKGSRPP